MPEHRKHCTEDFVLTEVMTRPPAFIYLAAGVGFVLAGLIYLFILKAIFYRGALPIAFGMMILVMMLLLKTQKKTIVIYLDEKSIFINGLRYLRKDIQSIDTYAYNQREYGKIYFLIKFKSKKKYYITDTRLFQCLDSSQAQQLKRLILAMEKRLNLESVQGSGRNNSITYTTSHQPSL